MKALVVDEEEDLPSMPEPSVAVIDTESSMESDSIHVSMGTGGLKGKDFHCSEGQEDDDDLGHIVSRFRCAC